MGLFRSKRSQASGFYNDIEVVSKEKYPIAAIDTLGEFITSYLFLLSAIWCFITGLGIDVHILTLQLGAFVIMFLCYMSMHYRYSKLSILMYIIFIILISWIIRDYIINGFFNIWNMFAAYFNMYYEASLYEFLIDEHIKMWSNTLFMLAIMTVIMFLYAYLKWRRNQSIIAFLLTIPLLIFPVLVGVLPDTICFIAYVAIGLSIIGGRRFKKVESTANIHARISRIVLCISILLFLFVYFIFPPSKYEKTVDVEKTKITMQNKLMSITKEDFFDGTILDEWLPFGNGVASGGLNSGRLGRAASVEFLNETALTIIASDNIQSGTFLRGYIGSQYNKDSWKQLSKADYKDLEQINLEYKASGATQELIENKRLEYVGFGNLCNMTIKEKSINKSGFLIPYFTNKPISINKKGQLIFNDIRKSNEYSISFNAFQYQNPYILSYFDNWIIMLDEDYSTIESKYRDYVYDVYTKLPDEYAELSSVMSVFQRDNNQLTINEVLERIQYITYYLKHETKYSLSPGLLPKGKDFVSYFLNENRKGYCTHYASAAAVMLRYLGIPTRYVEGYVITQYDIDKGSVSEKDKTITMNIKDSNAHAWIEVYLDKMGWVPFEVTPGYGGDGSIPEEIKNQIDMKYNNSNSNNLPANPIMPTNTPTKTPEKQNTDYANNNYEKKDTLPHLIVILQVIGIVFGFFLVVILVGTIRKCYSLAQRNNILQGTNNRDKIFWFVRRFDHILKYYDMCYHGEPNVEYIKRIEEKFHFIEKGKFQSVFKSILQAGYSDSDIEEGQVDELVCFYDKFCMDLYSESNLGLRLIWRLIGFF